MIQNFGLLPGGEAAHLYSICSGGITAGISDFGAHPGAPAGPGPHRSGVRRRPGLRHRRRLPEARRLSGAVVGRNANRIGRSAFILGGQEVSLTPNEGPNNLHSGPDYWFHRMWQVDRYTPGSITLSLETPDGDQASRRGTGGGDLYAAGKPPADSLPGAL